MLAYPNIAADMLTSKCVANKKIHSNYLRMSKCLMRLQTFPGKEKINQSLTKYSMSERELPYRD